MSEERPMDLIFEGLAEGLIMHGREEEHTYEPESKDEESYENFRVAYGKFTYNVAFIGGELYQIRRI